MNGNVCNFLFSLSVIADEEIEAQNLIKHGQIDQAIAIYQRLKPDSGRILHLLGVLHAEKKGDQHTAIDYFQQALQIKEEVCLKDILIVESLRLIVVERRRY